MLLLRLWNTFVLTFVAYQITSEEQKAGLALMGTRVRATLASTVQASMALIDSGTIQLAEPRLVIYQNHTIATAVTPIYGPFLLPFSPDDTIATIADIPPPLNESSLEATPNEYDSDDTIHFEIPEAHLFLYTRQQTITHCPPHSTSHNRSSPSSR
ncbi:hypothetical protein DFH07DRAFT_802056 [Mycena maculata]|uniref:Uncharacterized protein n=1 Tax=Mycena maculata TaxID=230809 RepID=A0AAD7JY31_9AGAR|nr:hypothetical protein DFH07DRAFT_802056 [Mycena maculata]